jgi:hypothetical protein
MRILCIQLFYERGRKKLGAFGDFGVWRNGEGEFWWLGIWKIWLEQVFGIIYQYLFYWNCLI